MLGDFEHPDLGEKHFELFISSGSQIALNQPSALVSQPFIFTSQYLQFLDLEKYLNNDRPGTALSFSDPPFFDSISNRGPPTFS